MKNKILLSVVLIFIGFIAGFGAQFYVNNASETAPVLGDELGFASQIIGTWQDSPSVGAGYGDLYSIESDGTFKFSYSQYDGEKRLIDISGTWEIVHSNLLSLTITQKTVIEGGEFSTDVASVVTDYILRNGTVRVYTLENPEIVLYPLEDLKASEERSGHLMVKIGGIQYYSLHSVK